MRRVLGLAFAFVAALVVCIPADADPGFGRRMRRVLLQQAAPPAPPVVPGAITAEFFAIHLNHPVAPNGTSPYSGAPPFPQKVIRTHSMGGFAGSTTSTTIAATRWDEIQPGDYGATPGAIQWKAFDEILAYQKLQGTTHVLIDFTNFPKWAMPNPSGTGGVPVCAPTSWSILDTWVDAIIDRVQGAGLTVLGFEGPNEAHFGDGGPDGDCLHDSFFWTSNAADRQELQNRIYAAVKASHPEVDVFVSPVNDINNTGMWNSFLGTNFDVGALHFYGFVPPVFTTSGVLTRLDQWIAAYGARTCQTSGRKWYGTEGQIDGSTTDEVGKAQWNAQWVLIAASKCASGLFIYQWATGEAATYALCVDTGFGGGRCTDEVGGSKLNNRGKAWKWGVDVLLGGHSFSQLSAASSLHQLTYTDDHGQQSLVAWNNVSDANAAFTFPAEYINCDQIDGTTVACSTISQVNGSPVRGRRW
jgi:hypothetical protein